MKRIYPARFKSASSFRTLGENSLACSYHRSVEDEYNFVRALVDAIENQKIQTRQGVMSLTSAEGSCGDRGSVSGADGNPGERTAIRRNSVFPPVRITGIAPAGKTEETPPTIDIEELMNERNNPQLLRQKKLPPKLQSSRRWPSPIPKGKGHLPPSRKVVFGYPTRELMMSQRDVVVPVISHSHSLLHLTGDVLSPSPRESLSAQGTHKGGLPNKFMIDQDPILYTQTKFQNGVQLRSNHAYFSGTQPTATQSYKQPSNIGIKLPDWQYQRERTSLNAPLSAVQERTQYRMRIRPQTRPLTSPTWKDQHQKSAAPIEINRPSSGGNKHTPRLTAGNVVSTSRENSSHSSGANVRASNNSQSKRQVEVHSGSAEGKTEMSKSTRTLTLSVFLPRENEEERICARADEATGSVGNSRQASAKSRDIKVRNDNTTHSVHQNAPLSDKPQKKSSEELNVGSPQALTTTPKDVLQGVHERKGEASPSAARRAIHCEVFGPDLCHDCQLQHELADMRTWQDEEYPDIGTEPKRLVAAPKLISSTLSVDLRLTDPVCRSADELCVHRVSAELDSVVSQNEIRSRIRANSASAKEHQA